MKRAGLLLLAAIFSTFCIAQQSETRDANNRVGSKAMCEAAAPKLREAQTNIVELAVTLDSRGKVQSFTTLSPKGLRLEKMKKVADEIKAMQFEPAKKDSRPVAVMIKASFECPTSATDGPPGR